MCLRKRKNAIKNGYEWRWHSKVEENQHDVCNNLKKGVRGSEKYILYLWKTSGDFLQSQWDKVFELLGSDVDTIAIWGTFTYTCLLYWIVASFYTFIDVTGKPKFAVKHRIQEISSYPVPFSSVLKLGRQVLINQFLSIPFYMVGYHLMVLRGYDTKKSLPSFQRAFFELLFCVLVEEIGFYYSHRVLHFPFFYKHIHKIHHEWKSPIALAAAYCHPIEHYFSNLIPAYLGPFLLGSHIFTCWIWYSIITFSTLINHSGFHFPFFPPPERHDFHHLKFNQSFGALGFLDYLHGTDVEFKKSESYRRNCWSFSLVPVKDLYPSDPKNN
ncbi:fatty acid hydroxylase domain-containing protein 2 [Trichonephila clavata]|uniref:Fatty acid hydroxylase domain-containing protein 2 n=1 Tax=Trichonephila clavata TaxID=2740835 RepID=A0A8X6G5R5_TRICU|nr:fatty acid hydroxylase domain-containing protein 2 [Trichonephila clavata]